MVHAFCALSRQSVTSQHAQLSCEQVDSKHRLLSVTSSSGPSSADVYRVRSTGLCRRRLTVLTLMMVFAILSWACGAAATVLQRRTLAGTVAACFYAVCTSTVALLLFVVHPSTSTHHLTSRCSWRIFTRSGCLEQLTSWRTFNDRRTASHIARQLPTAVTKQVVYSIANSTPPVFHVCTTPTFQAGDDVHYVTDVDGQEVALAMRDCTGSSCSVPASLSAAQHPLSVGECEQCKFCGSATDGSTDGRSFSRHSIRMEDFDDLSCSSDNEDYDVTLEGGWCNGEVDVDGCSIHRAPCPSPASACSSLATNHDLEDRCSESRLSPEHSAAASSSHGRYKRRWSGVGASPGTLRKTPRRRRQEDEAEDIRYRRRRKTNHSQSRRSECVRSASMDMCSPRLVMHQKRRRIIDKPQQSYCDTQWRI